jgi:hypothetical protein
MLRGPEAKFNLTPTIPPETRAMQEIQAGMTQASRLLVE